MSPSLGLTARADGSAGRRGFSLMELLLVIAVIGIGMVIVAPSMDTFLPKERLNTTVRSLTALLRETRSQAISRSLEFFVEYDLDENRYRRVTPFVLGGGRFNDTKDEDEDRVYGLWTSTADGVEITSVSVAGRLSTGGRAFARFDPRGAASEHQIVLCQPKYDNYYTIEILALTGTFKFHRGIFHRAAPDERDFE